MREKNTKLQLALTWISVVALLVGITAVTYAWFTFNAATNVQPMSSTVSQGDASLLIANTANGPFDTQCTLVFDSDPATLSPVSTSDLTGFYRSAVQDRTGISILYEDVTKTSTDYILTGTVYLQSLGGANQVYFLPSAFILGADVQTVSALRLGMQITINGQTTRYIFHLDGYVNGTPQALQTIPTAGMVVGGVNATGNAAYQKDPSVAITDYMAVESGNQDVAPQAGAASLCLLGDAEIATVKYWVYLEGCDANCIEAVQTHDVPIQLGFAGVPEGAGQ